MARPVNPAAVKAPVNAQGRRIAAAVVLFARKRNQCPLSDAPDRAVFNAATCSVVRMLRAWSSPSVACMSSILGRSLSASAPSRCTRRCARRNSARRPTVRDATSASTSRLPTTTPTTIQSTSMVVSLGHGDAVRVECPVCLFAYGLGQLGRIEYDNGRAEPEYEPPGPREVADAQRDPPQLTVGVGDRLARVILGDPPCAPAH